MLKNRLTFRMMLTVVLVLLASATAIAQQESASTALCSLPASAASNTDPLKAAEYILIQNQCLKQVLALRDEQLKAKDDRISAKDGEITTLKLQKSLIEGADKDRANANNIDTERVADCREQLAKADARIYQLEHPGILRTIFSKRSLGGFAIGATADHFLLNGQTPNIFNISR